MTTPEPFVDVQAVADYLAKPQSWVHDNQARLEIPRYKVGNQFRYRLSEVQEWVERRRVGGAS